MISLSLNSVYVLFLVIFPPLIEGGTTYLPVTVIRLFVIAAVSMRLIKAAGGRGLSMGRTGLGPPLAAFLVAAAVASVIAPYGYLAQQRLTGIVCYILIFFILHGSLSGSGPARLYALIAVMGAVEAALGAVQVHLLHLGRAKGTFFNPDFYGCYLAMTLPSMYSLALDKAGPRRARAAWAAGAAVAVYAVVLSQSRGAFVAASVASAVYFIARYRWLGGALAVVFSAALLLSATSLKDRFFMGSRDDPYSYYRLHIWRNALDRVAERPWGEGLGSYRLGSQARNFPAPDGPVRYSKTAESAHNGYLQVAVEMGVLGLAALMWGLARLFMVAMAGPPPGERRQAAALVAGLAAFLGHAMLDSTFSEPALVILALAMAAALAAVKVAHGADEAVLRFGGRPAAGYGIIVVMALLASVYVTLPLLGWTYYRESARRASSGPEAGARLLEKAVFFAPGNSAYHSALASCYFARYMDRRDPSDLGRSVDEMDLAIMHNPMEAELKARKGAMLSSAAFAASGGERRRLMGDALYWYLQAVGRNPYNAFYYRDASALALALGRPGEAESLLKKALGYEPGFLPARLALAKLCLASGRRGEAAAQLGRIKEIQGAFSANGYKALAEKGYQVDPGAVDSLLLAARAG